MRLRRWRSERRERRWRNLTHRPAYSQPPRRGTFPHAGADEDRRERLTRSRRVCPLRKKLRGFEHRKCGRVPGEGNPSLGETRLRATLPEVTNTLLRPSACAREGEPTDAVEGPPIDQDAPGPSTGQAQRRPGSLVARGREVHVVLRRAGPAPPQPQPIERNARTTAGVTMPGRSRERSMYACAPRSRVLPQPTYGFSNGLRSIARPYAWFDQLPVPEPPEQETARPAGNRTTRSRHRRPGARPRPIVVGEMHVADREPQGVELPEDRRSGAAAYSRATTSWPEGTPAVEPPVGDREEPQTAKGAQGSPVASSRRPDPPRATPAVVERTNGMEARRRTRSLTRTQRAQAATREGASRA